MILLKLVVKLICLPLFLICFLLGGFFSVIGRIGGYVVGALLLIFAAIFIYATYQYFAGQGEANQIIGAALGGLTFTAAAALCIFVPEFLMSLAERLLRIIRS